MSSGLIFKANFCLQNVQRALLRLLCAVSTSEELREPEAPCSTYTCTAQPSYSQVLLDCSGWTVLNPLLLCCNSSCVEVCYSASLPPSSLDILFSAGGCVHRCPAPSLQLAAFQTLDLGRRRKAQAVQRGQLVRVPKRGLIASASLGAAASPASQPEPACFAPLRAVAAAAVAVWHAVAARMAEAVLAARQRLDTPPPDPAAINAQIRSSVKQARMLSAVAPFAAASTYTGTTSNTLLLLTRAVASFIKVPPLPACLLTTAGAWLTPVPAEASWPAPKQSFLLVWPAPSGPREGASSCVLARCQGFNG